MNFHLDEFLYCFPLTFINAQMTVVISALQSTYGTYEQSEVTIGIQVIVVYDEEGY